MKQINGLQQGSQEWLELRAKYFTASEAPAMLGLSKYKSRDELLKEKALGIVESVSQEKQKLFDKGHDAESEARKIAEGIVGEELFAPIGVLEDKKLLASFDGLTLLNDMVWEHKLASEAVFSEIETSELSGTYWPQLEQQLLVSGAKRALFMSTDGTEENMRYMWYESQPERRDQLLRGWAQFEKDLADYQPKAEHVEAVGAAPNQLPALHIEVKGGVVASNLDAYTSHALAVFDGINTELSTDSDFADAEATVKWCKEVENKLDAAKSSAQGQMASIDDLFRAIDDIRETSRRKRLELEKLVKARKEQIRADLVTSAKLALTTHTARLEKNWDSEYKIPNVTPDFGSAIKGKRNISSIENAINSALANAKIEADKWSEIINANIDLLSAHRAEHGFLFKDSRDLVLKESEDLAAIITSRIADYKEQEKERLAREESQRKTEEEVKPANKTEETQAQEQNQAIDNSAPASEGAPIKTLGEKLDMWAIKYSVADDATNELLFILKQHSV